jgi:hypothetical protein
MLEEIADLHHSRSAINGYPAPGEKRHLSHHAMASNKKQPTTEPNEPYKRLSF